jgi:hypothetical protein
MPFPGAHRLPECNALLKAAGPGGGILEAIYFWRVAGDGEAEYPWLAQVRQLIMAADADNVPRALPEGACGPQDCHFRILKPRRRFVVSAVARTLQYPGALLDYQNVPVEHVIEYLKIRHGLRLVANYGRFRARQT